MSIGLLFGSDDMVAEVCFKTFGLVPFKYDACIGLIDPEGAIQGACMLHGYQGYDVQLSWYGVGTVTPGIARAVATFILEEFDPARLTFIVSKRNKRLIRSCQRFGFKLEGAQRCYYGNQDCNRNTGVRLVSFRDNIERVAAWKSLIRKAA